VISNKHNDGTSNHAATLSFYITSNLLLSNYFTTR